MTSRDQDYTTVKPLCRGADKVDTMKKASLLFFSLVAASSFSYASELLDTEELFALDMGQLLQLQVGSSATITPTIQRRMPATVTTVSPQMIIDSGARNLYDLLEIYVPDFHYLPHHWELPHLGMRAIIGDRDDKYLIVVNGRVMNELTHFGALSERDLPMLSDIRRIDVVRGPGSVIYGPGAVSMVISIYTNTFAEHGDDGVTVKLGAIEEFQSLEISKTMPLDGNNHGLWFYAGLSNYDGADNDDSPVVYGNSDTTVWGDPIEAGEHSTLDNPANRGSYQDRLKAKLHVDYQRDAFKAWMRYTQGGEQLAWSPKIVTDSPNGFADPDIQQADLTAHEVGYKQFVLDLAYNWIINDGLWLDLKGGYDSIEYVRYLFDNSIPDNPPENHREETYFVRGIVNWLPAANHSIAMGTEYAYSNWGLDTWGSPDVAARSSRLGEMEEWSTARYALVGEYQWQISKQWTSFLGARLDNDDYTDEMWSPRAALVYAPSVKDTLKAIYNRSVRKNNAEELRDQHLNGVKPDPEVLEGFEVTYQHKMDNGMTLLGAGFYNDVEIIGIDTGLLESTKVAEYDYFGLELEGSFLSDLWDVRFSHSYTKLNNFRVEPGKSQKVSVSHKGYGNDLSNWSNHISKFAAAYQYRPDWRFTGSLRVFWGYPGAEQTTLETNDNRDASEDGRSSSTALSDRGYSDSFDEAVFLDLGLQYKVSPSATIALQGYNLLGFVDDKYNKRMYLINVSNYRSDAAAFAINAHWKF